MEIFQKSPEGGWGWLVVAGAVVMQIWLAGLDRSFGLLFERLLDSFPEASATSVAGLLPVLNSIKLLMAPFAIYLCERTSYRVVCFLGGLGFALGIIFASQVRSFVAFYIFIGISGISVGFIYCPSLFLVLKYFDARRSLANGIAMSGPYFLVPLLFELLLETYDLRGCLLIYGGICLHIAASGLVMKNIRISEVKDAREISQPFLKSDLEHICDESTAVSRIRSLFRPTLLVICLSIFTNNLGIWSVFTFLPQVMLASGSFDELDAAVVLTTIALAEVFARPLSGFLFDLKFLRTRLHICLVLSLSISGTLTVVVGTMPLLVVKLVYSAWVAFGVLFGSFYSLLTVHGMVLIADTFKTCQVPAAVGTFQFFKGMGGILGPLLAAFIYEATSSVHFCFIFSGTTFLLAAFVMLFFCWFSDSSKNG